MSIILNKVKYEVKGLKSTSWIEDPKNIKYINDKNDRQKQIKSIVAHTHKGINGVLETGFGPNTDLDVKLAKYQIDTERQVSWDYTIDMNGDLLVQNDPLVHYSWQAGHFNSFSLGFEMIQKDNGNLFEGQIEKAVLLIDFLTLKLGIQRQIPWNSLKNEPCRGTINRLIKDGNAGVDFIGICGHRNITDQRGKGDPGDHLFYALKNAGYMLFDLDKKQDLEFWKQKQKDLGIDKKDCDGIPLKQTVDYIKASGNKTGLLVHRPIDNDYLTI